MRLDNDGADPSAHGLQRLTTAEFLNPFSQLMGGNLAQIQLLRNQDVGHAGDVFASIDDPVLQAEGPVNNETVPSGAVDLITTVKGSPILPMLEIAQDSGTGAVLSAQTFNDWAYTWMFTGRRMGMNSRTYVGDVVVFHNRPFAVENVGTAIPSAAGERVVEAIFGYGTTVTDFERQSTTGYSPQTRSVLLRWPAGQPDPVVNAASGSPTSPTSGSPLATRLASTASFTRASAATGIASPRPAISKTTPVCRRLTAAWLSRPSSPCSPAP